MTEGSNRETVRRHNLGLVLNHVHRAGQLSRSALTTATGLNRSTIGTLVSELEARGLVREGEAVVTGSRGRPSPMVATVEGPVGVLTADVQVSGITAAVVGLGGSIAHRTGVHSGTKQRTVDTTIDQLVDLIEQTMAQASGTSLVALAVSVAGIVRRSDGFVHLAPNLGWADVPLGDMLRARFTVAGLTVIVGNEADLGARAEHIRGAGAGTTDMVYVSGEVGVGGGVIVGGEPLAGGSGYAGEIGHMVINPNGLPCHCGSVGCWETEVGQRALLRHMGWADTGDRDAVDAVIREASAGSDRAQASWAAVGRWMGIGVANLINIFNPQRVVLGGLLARAYPHLIDAIRTEVDRCTLGPSRSVAAICAATLGEDSSLIGAGELAFAALLADPTVVPLLAELSDTATSPAATPA